MMFSARGDFWIPWSTDCKEFRCDGLKLLRALESIEIRFCRMNFGPIIIWFPAFGRRGLVFFKDISFVETVFKSFLVVRYF